MQAESPLRLDCGSVVSIPDQVSGALRGIGPLWLVESCLWLVVFFVRLPEQKTGGTAEAEPFVLKRMRGFLLFIHKE